MSLTFNLNNSTQRALDGAILGCVRDAVEFLADKHGFSAEEAFAEMNLTKMSSAPKKTKRAKAATLKVSVPLPFCGTLLSTCNAIRVNHGLHSQCMNAKTVCDISGEEKDYCKTCSKQANANDSGAPNAGDIRSRISGEWTVPSKLVTYGNVMEKLNISREKAEEEAAKLGLTIPEEEFTVVKGRRGRPKKDPSASTSSDDEAPKKRGRPKKQKKVIDSSAGDDLISQLVAQAAAESTTSDSDSDSMAEKQAAKEAAKAEKLAAKEAEKAEKLAAKEAEKAEKQAAKEAAKAEKQAAKAEKLAAKEAEKAEKLAAKEAEKAEKLAAKEAEKAEKIAALTKVENDAAAEASEELSEEEDVDSNSNSDDEETQSIQAKRVTINGSQYVMDKATNHLYDNTDHSELGLYYDEDSGEIKPIQEDD